MARVIKDLENPWRQLRATAKVARRARLGIRSGGDTLLDYRLTQDAWRGNERTTKNGFNLPFLRDVARFFLGGGREWPLRLGP